MPCLQRWRGVQGSASKDGAVVEREVRRRWFDL